MTRERNWIVMGVVVLFLALGQNANANFIPNGDMETGGTANTLPDGWVTDPGHLGDEGTEYADLPPGGGNQCAWLDNTSGNWWDHLLFLNLGDTLPHGATLDFSFWYKGQVRILTSGLIGGPSDSLGTVSQWTKVEYPGLVVDSDPGGSTTFKFYDTLSGVGDAILLIDNVELTPEPASMALLAVGGILCVVRRRR